MSASKIPDETRIAIWLAHRRRCVYCGDPLGLRDLAIDHIVPESIVHDAEEYARVKLEYGLDLDFQINSPQNLVAAHHNPCNSSKSNRTFQPGRARFFLELASAKEELVHRNIATLRLQAQKEKLLAVLRVALDSGSLTLEDISGLATDRSMVRLVSGIQFSDGSTADVIERDEIDELLDRSILLGGTSMIDGVEFANNTEKAMTIRTCREYRAAKAAGYYPLTTFAMKMEAFLISANAILAAVASGRVASVSYISNPHIGLADLHLLPKTVLPIIGPDADSVLAAISGATLADLAREKLLSNLVVSSTELRFEWEHSGAVFTELLRADLDGDGIEELLIRCYVYAVGGTLGIGSVAVLRRVSSHSLFELVPYDPAD